MPSPFPGMDPYLESPEFFPGLHDSMITYLREALQERLPAPYYAEIGARVWVEYSERTLEPDVDVLQSAQTPLPSQGGKEGATSAVAVSVQPVVVHVPNDETQETFLEIYTVQGERRLVTSIEVLSLSNKRAGEHGRELYLKKQREVLRTKTHLVEIDLLRGGIHSTAVPLDCARAQAGLFDYHICIRRFDDIQHFFVYPIRLEQRLPEFSIPLMPGDPPVLLDLQAVFNRCYDTGPYRRLHLYDESRPIPPLATEHSEWAGRLLREKGLVPAD